MRRGHLLGFGWVCLIDTSGGGSGGGRLRARWRWIHCGPTGYGGLGLSGFEIILLEIRNNVGLVDRLGYKLCKAVRLV